MEDSNRAILEEIRDLQREHLETYKRIAERSVSIQDKAVALQERAVARAEQIGMLYRRVVAGAAVALLIIFAVAIALVVHAYRLS
jgi:hypothetical protein